MISTKKLITVAIASLMSFTASAADVGPPADTIFHGGPIVTVNDKQPEGWQIAIHANGDRAIGQTLNLYGKLLAKEKDPASHRLRIEHFTVTTEKELTQAQKLGVVPGMTIGHVGYWGEVFHNHILGPERANRIDPTGIGSEVR